VTESINMVSAYPIFPPPFPQECQVPSFFDGTGREYLLSELYKTGPWVSSTGVLFDRSGPVTGWPVPENLQSNTRPTNTPTTVEANSSYGKNEPTQIVGSVLSTLQEPVFQDPITTAETDLRESWDSINAPDVYGVRIMFNAEHDANRTIVKFAPMLFDTSEEATALLAKLTSPDGVRQLLGWSFMGWLLPEDDNWIPLAMRICKLSEAPF
jgi:hypothetical protein